MKAGVLERWSNGVMDLVPNTPILQQPDLVSQIILIAQVEDRWQAPGLSNYLIFVVPVRLESAKQQKTEDQNVGIFLGYAEAG
jgi:hypothetical protein